MAAPAQAIPSAPNEAPFPYSPSIPQAGGRYVPLTGLSGNRSGVDFEFSLKFDSNHAASFFSQTILPQIEFQRYFQKLDNQNLHFTVTATNPEETAKITCLFLAYIPALTPLIEQLIEKGKSFSYVRDGQPIYIPIPGTDRSMYIMPTDLEIEKPIKAGETAIINTDINNVWEGAVFRKGEKATLFEIGGTHWQDVNTKPSPAPAAPCAASAAV